jgi:hypothetical protein
VYLILEDRADHEALPATPTQLWIIVTLEVAVRDALGEYLLLIYPSYSLSPDSEKQTDEGFWAPPFVGLPIPFTFDVPDSVGAVKRCFDSYEKQEDLKSRVEQLAYLLGLSNPQIVYLGRFTELKISPRTPSITKCYRIHRYSLREIDHKSRRNLADPECRKGYVFLPLNNMPAVVKQRDCAEHGRNEWLYLSKPINSNLQGILENPRLVDEMRSHAISLQGVEFFREEEGFIVAVDLAGYGTACKYAAEHMGSFDKTGREIATQLRMSVAGLFYAFLARIGLSQVHMAGDGLICGFPRRLFEDRDASRALQGFFGSYLEFLGEVETLNSYISDPACQVGSRIAVHYGPYRFGRVAQARSFAPDFDGAAIVEVARLEAALRLFLKGSIEAPRSKKRGHVAAPTFVHPWAGRHALACTYDATNRAQAFFRESTFLKDRGALEMSVKETSAKGTVFELMVSPNEATQK